MEFLDSTYLGNTVLDWLIAAGVMVGVAGILRVLVGWVLVGLGRWAERTHSQIDDLVIELGQRTRRILYFAVGLYAGSRPLSLPPLVRDGFEKFVIVVAMVQVGIWASTAVSAGIRLFQRRKYGGDAAVTTTFKMLDVIARLAIWVVVLLLVLDNVGVNVTALITGLGIGGIAIALAVQSILSDLFASLSIIFDRPFVPGDFIVLDAYKGTVQSIGMKTTQIQSATGEQIIVSNADLVSSRIRNYGRMKDRRGDFRIGVTYQTPRQKVEAIPGMIREAVEAQDNTRFDRSHFSEFGTFSLNFDTVYYMTVPDYKAFMDTQQAINLELMHRFEREGIQFAYPTQQIYVSGPDISEPSDPAPVDGS
jgi:small-conductance mechanosensitive channel